MNPYITPRYPVFIGPSLPLRNKDEEMCCMMAVMLFKPHRADKTTVKKADQTWLDVYEEFVASDYYTLHPEIAEMIANSQSLAQGRKQKAKELEEKNRLREEQGLGPMYETVEHKFASSLHSCIAGPEYNARRQEVGKLHGGQDALNIL